jgi:protein-tyrosine phosphatase
MFSRILMVCTGNICRSPMAEVVLAHRLRELGYSAVVESAGIAALVGRPAEHHAQELMRECGRDLSQHRSRQLTPEILRQFELVLVMEAAQQRAVEAMWPAVRGRVHRLGKMGNFDVPDPFRQDRPAFERAFEFIRHGLADFEKAFWSPRT